MDDMSGGRARGGGSGMTVKPGDRIWAGATFGETTDGRPTATVDGHGFLVDHPALPAVARWLAETPDAVERLWHVLDIYGNSAHAEVDAEQTLSSLLTALTGGEGAGGG